MSLSPTVAFIILQFPVEVTIGEPLCLVIARCYRLLRSLWRRAIKGTSGKPLGTSEKPLGTSGDRALLSAAAFVGTSEKPLGTTGKHLGTSGKRLGIWEPQGTA